MPTLYSLQTPPVLSTSAEDMGQAGIIIPIQLRELSLRH